MKRLVFGLLVGLMASGLLLAACSSVPGPGPAPATRTPILQATETTAAPTPTTGVIGPAPTISTGNPTTEPSPTSAPSPSSAPAATSAPTGPTSATTPAAAPSATRTTVAAACTTRTTFVTDVTIPDNTVVTPGQTFVKTWRVRNTGTCTWGSGYELVFVRGTAMTTTRTVAVSATAPGATVDLSVPMTAPTAAGRYSGFWRLRAPNGGLFGDTVWVTVQVSTGTLAPTTSPTP